MSNHKVCGGLNNPGAQREQVLRTRKIITISEVVKVLNVTRVTLDQWRRGSKRRSPLNVHEEKNGNSKRVIFLEDDAEKWLMAYKPELLKRWAARTKLRNL